MKPWFVEGNVHADLDITITLVQEGYRNGVKIGICMYWSAGLNSSEWLTQQFRMYVIVNIAFKLMEQVCKYWLYPWNIHVYSSNP